MRNFTIISLLFSALLLSSCELDEILNVEDGGVYGVVKDARTGAPIPSATVHINGPESLTATSDASGNFRFEDLEPGNYLLSAEKDRYITPYVETNIILNNFSRQDIEMEYESMLSTHVLDFGTQYDEMEIVVTNHLDRTVDVTMEENESWLIAHTVIFGLEPGQSDVLTVKVSRLTADPGVNTASLIVNIEEDFDFDIYESYVVEVRMEN